MNLALHIRHQILDYFYKSMTDLRKVTISFKSADSDRLSEGHGWEKNNFKDSFPVSVFSVFLCSKTNMQSDIKI